MIVSLVLGDSQMVHIGRLLLKKGMIKKSFTSIDSLSDIRNTFSCIKIKIIFFGGINV